MQFMLVAVLLSVSQPQEKSKEHPLLRVAKESLTDTTKPFTLLVKFKVQAGKGPAFEAAAAKHANESRKEKGNLAYELSRSAKGTIYVIYERWENLAALEAHLKTTHFKNATATLDPLLDGDLEVYLLVPVKAGN